jgi:hypothetical protein
LQIDTKAVAEARGYKNAGSVANRITKFKKKYNLPITSSLSGSRKVESSPAADTKVPITPNKNKVTKARSTRGRAVKVPKQAAKATSSGSEEFSGDEKGMIYAAPKKMAKFAATATDESSGDEDSKGFIYKAPKASGDEDAEASDDVAEDGEVGDEMEKSETLKVDDEHHHEV